MNLYCREFFQSYNGRTISLSREFASQVDCRHVGLSHVWSVLQNCQDQQPEEQEGRKPEKPRRWAFDQQSEIVWCDLCSFPVAHHPVQSCWRDLPCGQVVAFNVQNCRSYLYPYSAGVCESWKRGAPREEWEKVLQSTLLRFWNTSLPKCWSWLVTLPGTTRGRGFLPGICCWPWSMTKLMRLFPIFLLTWNSGMTRNWARSSLVSLSARWAQFCWILCLTDYVLQGGVVPSIHPVLLPGKVDSKKQLSGNKHGLLTNWRGFLKSGPILALFNLRILPIRVIPICKF